ncbi:MAG: restriction endonuclease [Bacteroidota bacterium]
MTDRQCQEKITAMEWADLQELWDQIQDCHTPDWDAGKAFEYLVVRMFELDGCKVRYPFSVSLPYKSSIMEQIDGVIYHDSIGILLESKDHSNKSEKTKRNINIEPIAKLRNQLQRRPYLTIGCVFSAGGYTEAVSTLIDYLGNETILIWHGEEIDHCLDKKEIKSCLVSEIEKIIELGVNDF